MPVNYFSWFSPSLDIDQLLSSTQLIHPHKNDSGQLDGVKMFELAATASTSLEKAGDPA